MKIKLLLFCSLSLFCSLLIGNTYEIKQDGLGDFTTIQAGIIASTHNDTILVYPGTYYENINYLGKSITVTSLYIIAQADSIINQTIIDGNRIGRCVTLENCVDASLIGFTIQQGKCTYNTTFSSFGGGVKVYSSTNILLKNNRIKENLASSGGGLGIFGSSITLSSNAIFKNRTILSSGGGINIQGNIYTDVIFDSLNLNSIYSNYSATGSDIYIYDNSVMATYNIIVDTFTVDNPGNYFIAYDNNYNFSCENYIFDEIDSDLYIASDGDDANSGLTVSEPLQTIAYAQALIKSNSENLNTIHIASGTYSASLNEQLYPLGIKDNVKMIGDSSENTILDAEHQSPLFLHYLHKDGYLAKYDLEKICLLNGSEIGSKGSIRLHKAEFSMKNVVVDYSYGLSASAILCKDGIYNFENLIIRNSQGGPALRFMCIYGENMDAMMNISLQNVTIENTHPQNNPDGGSGGANTIDGHPELNNNFYAKIVNCNINNNLDDFYYNGVGGTSGLHVSGNMKLDAVNCTFADNNLGYYTGATITVMNSELNIYNSILYGNDGYSINLWSNSEVNVYNSLIEGGVYNMHQYETPSEINWLEGNLGEFAEPYFIGEDTDYPFYSLEATSPCIDAGTLILPEGIELPEFDLAGNPRIYGETIDMGCYEFNNELHGVEEEEIILPKNTEILNYPNPFNPTTTIKLNLSETGNIDLSIYNIKGQKVKTLLDAYSCEGNFEIIWDGKNNNKKQVASGSYFIKLKVDGIEKAIKKCTLLK